MISNDFTCMRQLKKQRAAHFAPLKSSGRARYRWGKIYASYSRKKGVVSYNYEQYIPTGCRALLSDTFVVLILLFTAITISRFVLENWLFESSLYFYKPSILPSLSSQFAKLSISLVSFQIQYASCNFQKFSLKTKWSNQDDFSGFFIISKSIRVKKNVFWILILPCVSFDTAAGQLLRPFYCATCRSGRE